VTTDEIIDLLTLLAAYDRRTIGEGDVNAWMLAAGDLPYDDARHAVARHYRQSREWLMPADVRHLVKAVRDERLAAAPLPQPPPHLADDPASYVRELKEITRRAADGRTPFGALQGGRTCSEPPTAFKTTRKAEDNDRVLAQSVRCPVEWCPARPGEPCRSSPDLPAMRRWHPSRLDAARRASVPSL
jgi:hypothetical protein